MANEELNVNRDWAINVNLSGLVAPSGNKNMEVPEGYYKATITDMYINAERNPNRVIIKLTINDAPFTGVVRTDGLGVPKDDSDKVRYYWRALAESAGYTPAQLDKGAISLGLDTFKDRSVHVHYTPKGNGSEYDKTEYLAPADWSQQKQVFDLKANKTNGSAPAPAMTNGAGNTTTKNDVLSKLGL
jgi:hypothetical protein